MIPGIAISLAPETIGHLAGFPVTNSMLGMIVSAVILIFLARAVGRHPMLRPGKLQNAGEMVMEFLMNLIDSVTHNREKSKKFFPIIATIFLFVMVMNWSGLLPIYGTIGMHEVHEGHEIFVPFLRGGAADLNMTIAIAMVSVIAAQVFGILYLGAKKHWNKYFTTNATMAFPGIIEFIGEFTKIISFSFRLFGNVFAGEVLLVVISTLVPLAAPVPFYILELFVGFIQALVFALLTLVFFTVATAEEH
jgi:F-type H+-transporting ATPase subunit a